MKFTEAYEHLAAGHTLACEAGGDKFRVKGRVVDGRLHIQLQYSHPESDSETSLSWLEGVCKNRDVCVAPRDLPALPAGYEWIASTDASRPYGIRGGDTRHGIPAALTDLARDNYQRAADRHAAFAAAYAALVTEYETR